MAEGTVISVGTFDGFHRGHRAILETVREIANAHDYRSAVLAFETPPRHILQGRTSGGLILPRSIKRRLMEPFVDAVVPADFSEFRELDASTFVDDLRRTFPDLRYIVEGRSFRFGKARIGGLDTLIQLGEIHGFGLQVVPPVVVGGLPASSSRIRAALEQGDVALATEMLGRSPVLLGKVVPGNGVGRSLGFPTANLAIDADILRPASGIYWVKAYSLDQSFDGLLYVGNRPTFASDDPRCEIHLLASPDRDLYGAGFEAHLVRRIREDRRFPSLQALQHQIAQDVEVVRALIRASPCASERLT